MEERIRLSEVPTGMDVLIVSLDEGPSVSRLLAMGLRPGTRLRVARQASFGKTLFLDAGNRHYGIRRSEAAVIRVEKAP